jgi:hypothetical protein
MNKKDAAVTKILADLKLVDDTQLSPEQERVLQNALDPELQYLQDVEDLFNQS